MSSLSIDAVPAAAHGANSESTKKFLKRTSEVDRVVGTATVHLYPGEKRVRIEDMQGDSETLFQDVIDYSLANKCRSIATKVFNKEFDYEILKELPSAELKKALEKGLITKEEYISTLRARAVPKNSTSQHPLQVDMEGVSFACCEYSQGPVGMTLVKFDKAAKCHKDVRGGNPGLLDSQSNLGKGMVEGICVTGGSNPGLAAAASISDAVEIQFGEEHTCFEGVAIFSHNLVEKDDSQYYIADQRLGYFATAHLSKLLYSGQVGGGCSAAKGQGVAFGNVNNCKVAAIVVNNSWGDLYPDGNIPANQNLPKSIELVHPKQNTTITIVVTDLDLDQHELAQLSHQIHGPIMGRYIHPFHTLLDGDVFYACSTAKKKNKKLTNDVTKLTEFFKGVGEIVIQALKNSNHPKKH